jgi:hypothetical protein
MINSHGSFPIHKNCTYKKSIKIVTMVPINLFLRTKARYFSLEIYSKELLYAARSVLTLLDSHALPRARGLKTLGKGFAEGGPRQRALGKF